MVAPTLADLKAHLNMPGSGTSDDAELSRTLNASIELVQGLTGIGYGGSVVEQVDVHGGVVLLNGSPAGAVTVTGPAGPVTGWTLRADPRLLTGVVSTSPVMVTYLTAAGGWSDAVTLATLIIAAHLWETQRGNGPGVLDLQGDTDPVAALGLGYAVPSRARELLAPYIRSGQIA